MIIYMAAPFARGAMWVARRSAAILLALTISGLTAGLVLHLLGAGGAGNGAWAAVGVCGAGYALGAMAEAFRRGRIGVDVIALLAVVGALAVGELLAAAVISVMLASGRALETWAAERARRDLRTLLERAPRTARRYTGPTPPARYAPCATAGSAGSSWSPATAPRSPKSSAR